MKVYKKASNRKLNAEQKSKTRKANKPTIKAHNPIGLFLVPN